MFVIKRTRYDRSLLLIFVTTAKYALIINIIVIVIFFVRRRWTCWCSTLRSWTTRWRRPWERPRRPPSESGNGFRKRILISNENQGSENICKFSFVVFQEWRWFQAEMGSQTALVPPVVNAPTYSIKQLSLTNSSCWLCQHNPLKLNARWKILFSAEQQFSLLSLTKILDWYLKINRKAMLKTTRLISYVVNERGH